MAKRDELIRWAIGAVALLFLAVPFYRMCGGGAAPNGASLQRNSVSSDQTPRRPTSSIEMLHTAGSLEEAIAVMNLLPVRFRENSAQLAPESQPYVEETAAAIRRLAGDRKIEIVVFGREAKAAEAKAKSLQASLASRGVEPTTLTARGAADVSASTADRITYRIVSTAPLNANSRPKHVSVARP